MREREREDILDGMIGEERRRGNKRKIKKKFIIYFLKL
jgi:hypothetical protein